MPETTKPPHNTDSSNQSQHQPTSSLHSPHYSEMSLGSVFLLRDREVVYILFIAGQSFSISVVSARMWTHLKYLRPLARNMWFSGRIQALHMELGFHSWHCLWTRSSLWLSFPGGRHHPTGSEEWLSMAESLFLVEFWARPQKTGRAWTAFSTAIKVKAPKDS